MEADDSLTEPDQKPAGPSTAHPMEALQGRSGTLEWAGDPYPTRSHASRLLVVFIFRAWVLSMSLEELSS